MNIPTKIKMLFAYRLYPYSRKGDKLLRFLIKHGKNIHIDMVNCHIEYEDCMYSINLLGFPDYDLTNLVKRVKSMSEIVYSTKMSSSIRTRIKFWNFLEKTFGKQFISMYYGD